MISIVIPTANEAENIQKLVSYLQLYGGNGICEIIVSDAGSEDATLQLALEAGAIAITSPQIGRAAQMNAGAAVAKGEVFYFVHADSFPPPSFAADINKAVREGFAIGRYRTRFDSNKLLLQLNAFFTRFDLFACYGGDQTLFITSTLFAQLDGFDARMRIMEDYDIVKRARVAGRYRILTGTALVSARKYAANSWWQVQKANFAIIQMYRKGASQEAMVNRYKEMLSYR